MCLRIKRNDETGLKITVPFCSLGNIRYIHSAVRLNYLRGFLFAIRISCYMRLGRVGYGDL